MEYIDYEQPANEFLRACLRLEHCCEQITYYINNTAQWDSRHALTAIIDTLQLLDRPDLKSKLSQECHRLLESLNKMSQTPGVDQHKLSLTLRDLDESITYLNSLTGKFAAPLRDNYFIEHVRQMMQGMLCPLDSVGFHYWLSLPPETRINHLFAWQEHFSPSLKIVKLILRLIRQSQTPKTLSTEAGFYQQSMDATQPSAWQLIRVGVPRHLQCYPEISVGKHRLCIRFLSPNFDEKPTQCDDDITFQLTLGSL